MPSIGNITFKRDERFDDWWVSDPVSVPYVESSAIPIRITDVTHANFIDGRFPDDISNAVQTFVGLSNSERLSTTNLVYEYFKEHEPSCRILPRMLLGKSQVWHYSEPQYITVFRLLEDGRVYLAVSFECEWEMEHGMSFVFQDGQRLCRVGPDNFYEYSSLDGQQRITEQDGGGKEGNQVSIKHWKP